METTGLEEQMNKGLKKLMRSKDLHVGLLLLMASMDQAGAPCFSTSSTNDQAYQEGDEWKQ